MTRYGTLTGLMLSLMLAGCGDDAKGGAGAAGSAGAGGNAGAGAAGSGGAGSAGGAGSGGAGAGGRAGSGGAGSGGAGAGGRAGSGGAGSGGAGSGGAGSGGAGSGGAGSGGAGSGGMAGAGVTLRVDGRYLLDTCGNRLVIRGVEQIFGLGIDVGGSFTTLVDEIASTGANAVRVLPNIDQLDVAAVDRILERIVSHDMIFYVSPGDRAWFNQTEVKAMLTRYEPWLVVDAFQEPTYDNRTRWQTDAMGAIAAIRGQGYRVPITVLANQFGRDLPSLVMFGAEVLRADTLTNTVFGWQAYWGQSGWYQGEYMMSLAQGVERAAGMPFPVQAGIDAFADANDPMDYAAVMAAATPGELGWLWWDWYNPFGRRDNLTTDGTAGGLTDYGRAVVGDAQHGLRSARKACHPQGR